MNRYFLGIMLLGHLLVGCQWMSEVAYPNKTDIHLHIKAERNSNPDSAGHPQPVKMCVIEVTEANWTPPHFYEGQPCKNVRMDNTVMKFHQFMLTPSFENRLMISAKSGENRWLVIGAEFQTIKGATQLIKQRIIVKPNAVIDVKVHGNQLVFSHN